MIRDCHDIRKSEIEDGMIQDAEDRMTVEFYERGVFKVVCHGEPFTVDTLTNRGAGSCNCFPYLRYTKPELTAAIQSGTFNPDEPKWKCPHIVASDRALLAMFKRKLMEQFPDNEHSI